ncbi:MAG: type II toxin-antitoxin system HigB family toxin [Bryobacteraceae bacterium]
MWHWADAVESSTWRNPGDLKATFASASFVSDLTAFNIGGNKFRIATFVHYRASRSSTSRRSARTRNTTNGNFDRNY